ncbi:hypothetical protein HER18_02715 [Chryseobacterium sp. NEB161]|nr:hypothetical protein HER18_02715 [Chryseobacterium sp. NEB161]
MKKLSKRILKILLWPILRVDSIPFNDNGTPVLYCTLFVFCIPTVSKIYYK